MNNLYDYLVIRLYWWYESMEKGPSLFTAKGIAALHQALTVVLLAMFVLGKDFLNPSVLKGCDCIVGSFLLATAQKVL